MACGLQEFFSLHETGLVTSNSHKQLGSLLQTCPTLEIEQFLLAYHPEKLHLQILRAQAARSLGLHKLILEGIKSESKEVSRYYVQSDSLFSSVNNDIYDPNILIPLLQEVSYGSRNKILTNLGRHMRNEDTKKADLLFESIADIWDPVTALPLLCRSSDALIQRELNNGPSLSSTQLLTIARRFPKLALALLEKGNLHRNSPKAARFIIRKNIPDSLNYCLENPCDRLLSKIAMKYVLRNHIDIIMADPAKWASILDVECVKKVLKPETFELFILKQIESELKHRTSIQFSLKSYIYHLSPLALSSLMKKVDWAAIENFWENNVKLLERLEHGERNRIASDLFTNTKDIMWVPLMSCEMSIPIIKEKLRSEAKAFIRASLVEKLLETAAINKDKKALEEICEFVGVRYRNDREVLTAFFENLPDLTSAGEQMWTIVYSLANKIHDPTSYSYISYGTRRIFSAALKRNGKSGLKVYVARFLNPNICTESEEDFSNLEPELREECIALIFIPANVASDDSEMTSSLNQMLRVITKWNTSLTQPMVFENVNKFVLSNLESRSVVDFVLHGKNGFKTDFILNCFEVSGNPEFLRNIIGKRPEGLTVSRAAVDMMADKFIESGCWKYIKLLKTFKIKGHSDILKYLFEKSLAALRDPDCPAPRYAIFLLALTALDINEYLKEIQQFLGEIDVSEALAPPYLPHPEHTDSQDQENIFKQSQRKYSVYKGIGNSFSHIDKPKLIIKQLLKFCINGDMMLFVRDSVYSVCFSLPCADAKEVLALLVHKPVSVMKHALRIHRLVCDVTEQRDFLLALIESEKHITSRTVLLEYALTSLENTKKLEIWMAVKEMISRFTSKDEALVTLLLGKRVPLTFWEEYVKLLLEKTESLEDTTILLVSSVLTEIYNCIESFPISNQFHENLITEYFLSNRYFLEWQFHQSVCLLFVAYLKKKPKENFLSDIESKKLFLSERLNSVATKESIVAFDTDVGCHPTRRLLNQFVQHFCYQSRQQTGKDIEKNINKLCIFIDTLLSFINQIDENLLFRPYVSLSLTAIVTREVKNASDSTGSLVGQFIDRVYAKNPGLAQYVLPALIGPYFDVTDLFLLDILLPPEPRNPDTLLLRQIIVTLMLPDDWKKAKSLESFRKIYMPLVRNTPSEVILTLLD